MTEPRDHSRQGLEQRVSDLEVRQKEIRHEIWGSAEWGRPGFRQEMLDSLEEFREEIKEVRQVAEGLRQDRRDEQSERKGRDRFIGYTGITSFITLLTMIALFITIWRGLGGG